MPYYYRTSELVKATTWLKDHNLSTAYVINATAEVFVGTQATDGKHWVGIHHEACKHNRNQ